MKKTLVISLLFFSLTTFSQIHPAASLQASQKPELADTAKVLSLAELAQTYWYSNPDTSFYLAQKGFALARQINFVRGEADCLRNLGVVLDLS